MEEVGRSERFLFVGNQLVLDFVNTQVVGSAGTADLLENFEGLVAWGREAGFLEEEESRDLAARWRGDALADEAFAKGVAFRATLRFMAERLAAGNAVPEAALDAINEALGARKGLLEVVRTERGFEKRFRRRYDVPTDLLVPVAEAAADLLSDGNLTLVKKCENPACILFYCDTTKNHARRWCSMAACGNRAKAAAHYQRTRRRQAEGD